MAVADRTEPVASTAPLPTPRAELDAAVEAVAAAADSWARLATEERIALLDELIAAFLAVSPRWVEASEGAEGIDPEGPYGGEEWVVGPYIVLRNLRLLREALADVAEGGAPAVPGPVTTREGGQVVAQVFPASLFDRLCFPGVTGEVWMEPGVTRAGLAETQAVAYRGAPPPGRVALVLGAGNVSSIGPMDALYKLFVEKRAVVLKAHPVNAFLGPLLEEAFRPLGERGWFRVVYGGAEEGAYLCEHPRVDEIHITGSDRTYEAIVFGPGEEGRRAKAERRPRLGKPVSAELGNVSPVVVVPGPWSAGGFAYQAENLASMLTNNAGFNCNAARVIVQHDGWAGRGRLLDELRRVLAAAPVRRAYYPGAAERWRRVAEAHPEAERFGGGEGTVLPWLLVPGVDPEGLGEICFEVEAFTGVFAETALAGATTAEFLERAVAFANERLWGTLSATLVVHPASLRDRATAAAVERAIADLRYGCVTVNHWAGVGFGVGNLPWGAYPGSTPWDIQSGTGWVHNTPMFSRIEKAVVRSAFRAWPKPPWFVTHRTGQALGEELARFEASPSIFRLPGVVWQALRG
jgi:acyl-CoA reductase-like NAD-dependent aldehyde dehydrogenase